MATIQPKKIDRIPEGIQIEWQDGHVSRYGVEFLRRKCPCAVCKEAPDRIKGMIPMYMLPKTAMEIQSAQPVGWYALQFRFSDGHDTGIFSYEFLRQECPCAECVKSS